MLKFKEGLTLELINSKVNNGLTKHLGIDIYEMGEDWLKAKMPVTDNHKQPFGLLHGGASAVLAESLGSIGSFMMVDGSQFNVVGIEVNAKHLRSAKDGYVYAIAKPIHTGRTVHIWDVEIKDELEKLICKATLTTMIVKK